MTFAASGCSPAGLPLLGSLGGVSPFAPKRVDRGPAPNGRLLRFEIDLAELPSC